LHKVTPFCAKRPAIRYFSLHKTQKNEEKLAGMKKNPLLCVVKTLITHLKPFAYRETLLLNQSLRRNE
jgi:hypothetical protein